MVTATIIASQPSYSNVTISLTPERARKWHQAMKPVVSASPHRLQVIERDDRLKKFKIRLVQRELIIESYRLFGNRRPDFSLNDEQIVGRNIFYDFLLKEKSLLRTFLTDSWSNLSTSPISINDLLDVLKPSGVLKDANSLAHDVTYDDIWLAIQLMKKTNVEDGEKWEKIASLVTDVEVVSTWESNDQEIKDVCRAKRNRMESHALRKEAGDFQTKRKIEQRKRHLRKLEREGLILTPESLLWWKYSFFVLAICFFVFAIYFFVFAMYVLKRL